MSVLQQANRALGEGPLGRWAVTQAVVWSAPYFRSIRPKFEVLRPGEVVVRMRKRRSVTNHLGTVHAIAMCNMAELAGGTAMELSIPGHLRWIPVGMQVQYLKLAKTDLKATCRIDPAVMKQEGDVTTAVEVHDTGGQLVFRADITMRVSKKR